MNKIPLSVQKIIEKLSLSTHFNPSEVAQIVKEANVQPEELMPWADFNHPKEDSYGRKMLYKAPNFEIMVMSWVPGDISAIHNHGFTTWGAVQIFGENEHATFRIEDNVISTLSRSNFSYGQVVGVGHNLVHQMGNMTNQNILTLHIYGLEKAKENVTGDANLYDVTKGETQIINGGIFYDLKPNQIEKIIKNPVGDFPTKLRDNIEWTNRVAKINPADSRIAEKKNFLVSPKMVEELKDYISSINHENLISNNATKWNILDQEINALKKLMGSDNALVETYNDLVCEPCLT